MPTGKKSEGDGRKPTPRKEASELRSGIAASPLTEAEARKLTNEVKADAATLWAKLLHLYEGGAHTALGYSSWAAYCAAEFDVGRSHAYRLLGAGRVVDVLEAQSPVGDSPPSEAVARELAVLQREDEQQMIEVWRDLRSKHGKDVTAELVHRTVSTRLNRAGKRGDKQKQAAGQQSLDGKEEPPEREKLVLDPYPPEQYERLLKAFNDLGKRWKTNRREEIVFRAVVGTSEKWREIDRLLRNETARQAIARERREKKAAQDKGEKKPAPKRTTQANQAKQTKGAKQEAGA